MSKLLAADILLSLAHMTGAQQVQHLTNELEQTRKAERTRILREVLDLASALELANADDADQAAQDFARGVRSAGRRLSKLVDRLVKP